MRSSLAWAAAFLVLLAACSPAPEATPGLEDALSRFSPTQVSASSTPRPTATTSVPTATSQDEESATQTAEELATGEIFGRITNGTAGGEVPDDLTVTLYGVEGEAVVLELASQAGADGEFTFDGVAIAAGRKFVVAVEHQGVLYFTEAESMPPDLARLEMPLTIYDTTDDPAHVSVEQLHVLLDFSNAGVMSVLEVWVYSNYGDRTYMASDGGVEIALPDGASALRFQDTATRFQLTDGGFYDLAPVRPGTGSSELLFTFELPYDRRFDFIQPMSLVVQGVDVLIPEGGPQIREGDLIDIGIREVSSGTLRTYSTGPLAAGESLEFRVTGRIPGAEGGVDLTPLMGLVIGGGLLGIVLVGLGLWWSRSGRRPPSKDITGGEEDVLQEIARLDDEYAAGRVQEVEYHKRRAELKRRAMDLMQEEND